MSHIWSRGQHLLLWVHTGSAEIELAGGKRVPLAAGEAAWVPARMDRTLYTQAGTVAFPLLSGSADMAGAPSAITRFSVSEDLGDHLIHHFVIGVSPVRTLGYSRAELLALVDRRRRRGPDTPTPHYPRFPHSKPADCVARELLHNPALDHTLERWAALMACSPSKLGRDFQRGTGLGFARWRQAVRLAVAAELLGTGQPVARVAALTGFTSRRGFTSTFRSTYGYPPSQHTREHDDTPPVENARLSLLREPGGPVPSTYTAPRVNPFHVLLWMYRGNGHARIGERRVQFSSGDTIWLPAGVENQTGSEAGGIWVPLGDIFPADMHPTDAAYTRFDAAWERFLLYCSITSYMMLRPEHYDYRHVRELFNNQLAERRAALIPMPATPRAHAVAIEFLSADRLPTRPASTTPTIERAFREETGMSFGAWQHVARMHVAREVLKTENKVSGVATRVGYTQLSNFSRAYARYFGVPPSDHRRASGRH